MAAGNVAAAREKSAGAPARSKRAGSLERLHELRDMLTLLRNLQIKPADARRKDLKKVESVLAELQVLSKGWA